MTDGRLPEFLIVGAQRAGTTSLFRYLAAHPDVSVPSEKELHFFSYNGARGIDWYASQFPRDGAVAGEATPYYLFHPLAPRRVAAALRNARIIALLRDPVGRAVSHHAHEWATGFEPLPLGAAIDLEEERLRGETERMLADETYYSFAHQHWTYAARGRYAEQLERWFEVVPRERWLILWSDDLFRDPGVALAEAVAFLGLPEWRPSRFERFNASEAPGVDRAVVTRLREAFVPDDQRLSRLLGSDVPWRR